jgi:hypothetical protein
VLASGKLNLDSLKTVQILAVIIVGLTIGVQVAIQRLSTLTKNSLPYIAFEVGVLMAPMLISILKLRLTEFDGGIRNSRISVLGNYALAAPYFLGAIFFFMIFAIIGIPQFGMESVLIGTGLGLAAMGYEVFAIIGFEAVSALSPTRGNVAIIFGVMGAASTLVYAFLLWAGENYSLLLWLVGGSAVAVMLSSLINVRPRLSNNS